MFWKFSDSMRYCASNSSFTCSSHAFCRQCECTCVSERIRYMWTYVILLFCRSKRKRTDERRNKNWSNVTGTELNHSTSTRYTGYVAEELFFVSHIRIVYKYFRSLALYLCCFFSLFLSLLFIVFFCSLNETLFIRLFF